MVERRADPRHVTSYLSPLADQLWWPTRPLEPKPVVLRPEGASHSLDVASNRLCTWRDISHPSRPVEAPVMKVVPSRVQHVVTTVEKPVPVPVQKIVEKEVIREVRVQQPGRPVRIRVSRRVKRAPEPCCCLPPCKPCKPCCECWTEFVGWSCCGSACDGDEYSEVWHDEVHFDPWVLPLRPSDDPTVRSGWCCWCWPLCWPNPGGPTSSFSLIEISPTAAPSVHRSAQAATVQVRSTPQATRCVPMSRRSLGRLRLHFRFSGDVTRSRRRRLCRKRSIAKL